MAGKYDVLIAGSGPIGSATAYFLTLAHPDLHVGLITQDPTDDPSATYTQAGGSLRWVWDDPLKAEMTSETAKFIKSMAAEGADVSLIEDNYVYLYTGACHPSINFSGKKVVEHLLEVAGQRGLELIKGAKITKVEHNGSGVRVTAGETVYEAERVLLALGVANAEFMPGYELEREKRQLFVLDKPVDAGDHAFPHVIARVRDDGYAYVFLKQTPSGIRYVVGQEDIIEDTEAGANDYWKALLEAGVADVFPFLSDTSVETIWHGFDAGNKQLKLESKEGRLFAANCGSAARSCAWIGRTLAEKLAA